MRDYMNAILQFIGAESLTDEEFGTVSITDINDDLAVYDNLLLILQAREVVSDATSRLLSYFQAKGLNAPAPNNASSNIFVGSAL